MSQRLHDKVCIVTGSSSGLGRAIALAYAREGARGIVCADLQPSARAEIADEVGAATHDLIEKEFGEGRSIFVKTDVSRSEDVKGLVDKAVEVYGRIDVYVNNAGVSLESSRPQMKVHETPDDVFDVTMAINTRSVFLGCKYACGQMVTQDADEKGDRGYIINMSSIFGLVGGYSNCSYAASKGAVTNMTRTVALDYGRLGIHCNAICPGFTQTAIFKNTIQNFDETRIRMAHPLHGAGTPDDLVGAAIFLANAESRWITGVNLPVDGGFVAQ